MWCAVCLCLCLPSRHQQMAWPLCGGAACKNDICAGVTICSFDTHLLKGFMFCWERRVISLTSVCETCIYGLEGVGGCCVVLWTQLHPGSNLVSSSPSSGIITVVPVSLLLQSWKSRQFLQSCSSHYADCATLFCPYTRLMLVINFNQNVNWTREVLTCDCSACTK